MLLWVADERNDDVKRTGKLTALRTQRLTKAGRYADGNGLYLQISKTGSKSWLYRYMISGRARSMGLGPLAAVSLAQARKRAAAAHGQRYDTGDPIEARRETRMAKRAAEAARITFKEAATRYIAAHRTGWKNEKHAAQWQATLERYAFPVIGEISVDAIDTAHIITILESLWITRTETASRVRGRIEKILGWATTRHYRKGDNPARWRGHLDTLLPATTKVAKPKHYQALPHGEIPAFMAELRQLDSISARALELTILCATRTGETLGAEWREIDFDSKVWAVPGERTKSGRIHRVPLSERVMSLLAELPRVRGEPHVFPGARPGHGLSNMAMLELLRGMRGRGATVHGDSGPPSEIGQARAPTSPARLQRPHWRTLSETKQSRLIVARTPWRSAGTLWRRGPGMRSHHHGGPPRFYESTRGHSVNIFCHNCPQALVFVRKQNSSHDAARLRVITMNVQG